MTPRPDPSPRPADVVAPGQAGLTRQERLLAELEEALSQQVRCAGRGDLEGILALGEVVDELLSRTTTSAPPLTLTAAERLERIRALRHRLELTLAALKAQLARDLERMRLGKRTLRAYQQSRT